MYIHLTPHRQITMGFFYVITNVYTYSGNWHILIRSAAWFNRVKQRRPMIGDRIDMSITGDSLSDETLNRGPWRCSSGDSLNFPLELSN